MSAILNMPASPAIVKPGDGAMLPECLTALPQWVNWTYERRDGEWNKVPKMPTGRNAGSNNPATWTTYQKVAQAAREHSEFGVGFVFSPDDPFVGIDLDDCLAPDGTPKQWAAPILERFHTYMEISPSGNGVKLWARASLAGLVAKTGTQRKYGDGKVEVYQHGRFFTVTGRAFNGAPLSLREHQADVEWLLRLINAVAPASEAERAIPAESAPEPASPLEPARTLSSDDLAALHAKMDAARANIPKFAELWEGGCGFASGKPDASAGDLSFCNFLAFHLELDAAEIDAAFRMSERMRRKWDERHYSDGRTYGQATIQKALEWATAERHRAAMPDKVVAMLSASGGATIDHLNGNPMFADAGVAWARFEQSGDLLFGYTKDGKRVRWNSITDLLSFAKSQATIAKYLQIVIPTPPCAKGTKVKAIWEPIAQLMLRAATVVNAGEDLETEVADLVAMAFRRAGSPVALSDFDVYRFMLQVREWKRDPYTSEGVESGSIPPPCVFVFDGHVFVHAPTLRLWGSLPRVTNRSLSRADINRELQLLGFKFVRDFKRVHDGVEVRLDVWRGPLTALGESQSELVKK